MTSRTPLMIALSGSGSNCGKTSLVCALIEALRGEHTVAALKVSTSTPDHRCGRTGLLCDCLKFDGQMRVLKEKEYTDRPGKDTLRMGQSGASPVWWMQTTSDFSVEAARHTLDDAPVADLWIVEGGAFVREEMADIGIAMCRLGDDEAAAKVGFSAAVAKAHFQVRSHKKSDDGDDKPPSSEPGVIVFDPEGGEVPGPLLSHVRHALASHNP
ncbi:MAG: hypothetical protein V3W41_02285 [Planctomycetota bacterium]